MEISWRLFYSIFFSTDRYKIKERKKICKRKRTELTGTCAFYRLAVDMCIHVTTERQGPCCINLGFVLLAMMIYEPPSFFTWRLSLYIQSLSIPISFALRFHSSRKQISSLAMSLSIEQLLCWSRLIYVEFVEALRSPNRLNPRLWRRTRIDSNTASEVIKSPKRKPNWKKWKQKQKKKNDSQRFSPVHGDFYFKND